MGKKDYVDHHRNWYAEMMNEKYNCDEQDFAMTLKETSPEVKGWFYQMEGALKDVWIAIWNWQGNHYQHCAKKAHHVLMTTC